jgi:hypothetical protein
MNQQPLVPEKLVAANSAYVICTAPRNPASRQDRSHCIAVAKIRNPDPARPTRLSAAAKQSVSRTWPSGAPGNPMLAGNRAYDQTGRVARHRECAEIERSA